MSCSRLSWFLTATSMAAKRRRMASAAGTAHAGPPVAVAAPGQVHGGQVLVAAASPGSRAGAGCRTRRRRAWLRRCEGRRRRTRPGRSASSRRAIRWGKASRKKPEMRSTTSTRGRPSSAAVDELDPGHPAGFVLPDRPDPEQGQGLGHVVAPGAHGRRPPHDQADGLRVATLVGEVAFEQPVGQGLARPPTPAGTGGPSGRPSRSCARWAGRGPSPGWGRRSGPGGTHRPSRAASTRSDLVGGAIESRTERLPSPRPSTAASSGGRAAACTFQQPRGTRLPPRRPRPGRRRRRGQAEPVGRRPAGATARRPWGRRVNARAGRAEPRRRGPGRARGGRRGSGRP